MHTEDGQPSGIHVRPGGQERHRRAQVLNLGDRVLQAERG